MSKAELANEDVLAEVMADLIENTDFPLLREQKLSLLEFLDEFPTHKRALAFTGILHLIDAFQDACVKSGVPDSEVYLVGDCEVCGKPTLPGKTYCEADGYCHEVADRNS